MTEAVRHHGRENWSDPAAEAGDAAAVAGAAPALLAGPWSRFWARSIDITLTIAPLAIVVDIVFPALFEEPVFATRLGDLVTAIILLPLMLIADACLLSAWGRSPGKLVAGLAVRDRNGAPPSLDMAIIRNLGLYARGCMMGFPILMPLTLIASYHAVSVKGVTCWDEDSDSYVVLAGYAERTARAAIVAVALMIMFWFAAIVP